MKDFKLKDAEHVIKPRSNKKLVDETVKRIKETGEVTPKEYIEITQPNKKQNRIKEVEPQLLKAKEAGTLGVPPSFFDLSIQEQSMLMFYLSSDFVHPITGKPTHMNILQSYISAYMEKSEVLQIWEIVELTNKDGETYDTKLKIKNPKRYADVQAKALTKFNQNPKITETWQDMVKLTFGSDPGDMIRNAILQDALYSEQQADKNANRRMAIDILGLGKEHQGNILNVFLDGGGKELADALKHDEYIVTVADLEVD